jgi:putative endonuclease
MPRAAYVYMLASRRYGTLYIGVTSDLVKRIWQHREGLIDGFTRQYGVKLLVWYEIHAEMLDAITREKQIKEWTRDWKLRLVHELNPGWRDLYPEII